jgi:hypothetical protein
VYANLKAVIADGHGVGIQDFKAIRIHHEEGGSHMIQVIKRVHEISSLCLDDISAHSRYLAHHLFKVSWLEASVLKVYREDPGNLVVVICRNPQARMGGLQFLPLVVDRSAQDLAQKLQLVIHEHGHVYRGEISPELLIFQDISIEILDDI